MAGEQVQLLLPKFFPITLPASFPLPVPGAGCGVSVGGRLWITPMLIFPVLLPHSQVSFEEESQNPPAVGHWKPLMPSKGDKEEPESGCQDAGGVPEPQATEQLNVSRLRSSSVEIREKGSEFLRDELHKAQKVSSRVFGNSLGGVAQVGAGGAFLEVVTGVLGQGSGAGVGRKGSD